MKPQRIIIGMTGASGTIYGVRLLEILKQAGIETHLVMSASAEITLGIETAYTVSDLKKLATVIHPVKNIAANLSSGSYPTDGMIIAPCSIKSMSEIATGVTSNLLTRAADVTLKQRRKLVLMVRETPLHTGHLETMAKVSSYGAIVFPPVPAFYSKPATLEQMVDQTLARVLDLFGWEIPELVRWRDGQGESRENKILKPNLGLVSPEN